VIKNDHSRAGPCVNLPPATTQLWWDFAVCKCRHKKSPETLTLRHWHCGSWSSFFIILRYISGFLVSL